MTLLRIIFIFYFVFVTLLTHIVLFFINVLFRKKNLIREIILFFYFKGTYKHLKVMSYPIFKKALPRAFEDKGIKTFFKEEIKADKQD